MLNRNSVKLLLIISCFLISLPNIWAAYTIEGTVNLKGNWQHQIYLATIDRLDDYYKADAAYTINQAPIDADGKFKITGDNLPDHKQFYRLYLIKEAESEFDVCLHVGGDNHNFIHLLLNNQSQIKIEANQETFAPFGDYLLNGDQENHSMKQLSQLIYPSHYFYEIKFPAELKFSRDKLNRDLFNFADTCQSTMVALAAINNTDFENYTDAHSSNYEAVIDQLKANFPDHPYTSNFSRKYRYFTDEWDQPDSSSRIINIILGFLCLGFLLRILKLEKDLARSKSTPKKMESTLLTNQEKKILHLIAQGKLNKEIAGELFIELSTVKTHINKIYSKLEVKNRQEVIERSKQLKL